MAQELCEACGAVATNRVQDLVALPPVGNFQGYQGTGVWHTYCDEHTPPSRFADE